MNEWMNGWMDEWMDGWMNEWKLPLANDTPLNKSGARRRLI